MQLVCCSQKLHPLNALAMKQKKRGTVLKKVVQLRSVAVLAHQLDLKRLKLQWRPHALVQAQNT
jgi:hypothetical protein